ncbi:MAG: DDE-type integrase/transposase/recombinase [Nostoc sp. ChiQUE01a]|nr:DDE-type integrase/transposase/recombinase [Nostoc sp. ChiQUE01a]
MNEDLFVNDLIQWQLGENSHLIKRILWIDGDYNIAFVININSEKGLPECKKVSEILEDMSDGLAFKQKQDPWARIIREENLKDKEKQYRDKAWKIISSLVTQEPSIYYRNSRGMLIKQVITKYNEGKDKDKLIEKTVYGYLRRFWQRGKNLNALIPDFINSSGKGQIRRQSGKKIGRPRKYAHEPEVGKGVNITEQDRILFKLAIGEYYNVKNGNSLQIAYELMIMDYYPEATRYDENGVLKPILTPNSKAPTIAQFRYWYQREQDNIIETVRSQKGDKQFALENRAILGTSKMETIGPGSRYQIDATVADVYLVSKYNRNCIIGRPIIYIVIDVFSRMITGVYVGLEGPSWAGAMMALANVATDKTLFCKEYNINITEDEWSCNQMPDAILGDRGELAGMAVEQLIPNLHIRIENAASYRADWKGLIERFFCTIHAYIKPFLPGYVNTDFRKRGGRDYRLDSKLDIDQFTKIIIKLIIFHNNKPLNQYERDEEIIADDVPPIPSELWKWGITNRSGRLRTFPEDIVKLNLMPTEKATITAQGIKLRGKNMYYNCERAEKEQWFEKARSGILSKSEKSLIVSYDIRNPNFVYLLSEDGRNFEKCFLIDVEGRYKNKNFYDIEYLLAYEELQRQKAKGKTQQDKADLIADIRHEVSEAENMTEAAQDKELSKSKKVSDITKHRDDEKAQRRENEAFELPSVKNKSSSKPLNTEPENLEQLSSLQPNYLDLLKLKRQEHKHGKE